MIPRLPTGYSHPMRVGEGAFASVYRVRQTALDRLVAIKVLHEKDPAKKRDIMKEATTQARIRADCIPQVYHVFEWRSQVCIVMEWIKGVSLSSLVAHFPSTEERLWLADHMIRSLAALHTLGFAHRDLKPENILVSPDKGVMFVDFGFTKNVSDGRQSVSGIVKGTPAYMAPELWTGGQGVDPLRCDVFAAGRILHDIVPGEPYAAFLAGCTRDDPSKRPASGSEMLALWQRTAMHVGQPNWRRLSQALSSEQLSVKLAAAARLLLHGGREDEAYWLLVESIEENPKNTEAVGLMNSFPKYVQRKRIRRRIGYAAVASACACLLLFAFAVGRRSRDWTPDNSAVSLRMSLHHDRTKTLASMLRTGGLASAGAAVGNVPFRLDSAGCGRLCGTLYVPARPSHGKLLVNGTAVDRVTDYTSGIALPPGMHSLAWSDEHGRLLWREKVTMLPFESKSIAIAEVQ
ncbi:MAG TPA: serine/threonine-protein kinase [Chitinivibrionales bacterium]|nr:serine/threonine-protein kinase [Chitinivibrionales bacterium]